MIANDNRGMTTACRRERKRHWGAPARYKNDKHVTVLKTMTTQIIIQIKILFEFKSTLRTKWT